MEIIPVIDLLGGVVVQARHGDRDRYRPVNTPLCRSCNPFAVVDAFLALHPFRTLYIADLGALMGQGSQAELIADLAAAYPNVRFWVDGGWPAQTGNWTCVVGTESLDQAHWAHLAHQPGDWILSLDFFGGEFTGPTMIRTETASWPERTIVMSLNRVGGESGPDWEQLERIRRLAPEKRIIAAGGVRNLTDLERLGRMGINSALIASALHDGRLVPA